MPPKISFLKRTQTKVIKDLYDKHHVVQDLIIPIQLLKKALLFFDKEINVRTRISTYYISKLIRKAGIAMDFLTNLFSLTIFNLDSHWELTRITDGFVCPGLPNLVVPCSAT